MPIMIGGGEFIINGAERVVVSQLHRSPGVDFVVEVHEGDRKLHSCRIIPERGSWIEINVTKKDTLGVRIDQSASSPRRRCCARWTRVQHDRPRSSASSTTDREVKLTKAEVAQSLVGDRRARSPMPMVAVDDVIDPETGEVYLDAGKPFTNEKLDKPIAASIHEVEVIREHPKDPIILNSLAEDGTEHRTRRRCSKIYQRLRPGNPPQLEKARELFKEKFLDANRYRLGRVGRFRINRKFDQNVPETEMTLRRGLRQLDQVPARPALRPAGHGWTTSTTSATAACGRSTSWPPTNSARASSSSAAPCRSGWRSRTSRT